jgi:hypothetical protein
MLRQLLREPLVHFLLLGGALFAIFGGRALDAGGDNPQIVVRKADINRLAAGFFQTWHRPPDAGELQAKIDDYIREEVLYRTALALGLDKDDMIIRRRLRQKMEFTFEDTVPPPQEAELRSYFAALADKFRTQPLISFRQVFVSAGRGDTAQSDARQILAHLVSATPGAENDGDSLLLGEGFSQTPLDRIAALFGDDFAHTLAQVSSGHWVGPLRSSYGWHLIFVTETKAAELPPFDQMRPAVEREWFAEHRAAALTAQYQALLASLAVRGRAQPPRPQYPPTSPDSDGPHHHSHAGNARRAPRAASAGRGLHRPQHPPLGLRRAQAPQRAPRLDGPLALGRGLCVRSAAWPWVCLHLARRRIAAGRNPACLICL